MGLSCWALRCTQNLAVEEFWGGIATAVLIVAWIVLFIRLLQGPE